MLGEGLSLRLISSSLSIPVTTVGDYVRRAGNAGLSWPLPDDLSDDELEKMLFGNRRRSLSGIRDGKVPAGRICR